MRFPHQRIIVKNLHVATEYFPALPAQNRLFSRRFRYPRIAYALHRAGLAEQWGTGTTRMISQCSEHGIGVEFMNSGASFVVRLCSANEPHPGTPRGALADVVRELGATHGFTRSDFERVSGLSRRQSVRELNQLISSGVLSREGKGPATLYWVEKGAS